jgi:hypothetical protein
MILLGQQMVPSDRNDTRVRFLPPLHQNKPSVRPAASAPGTAMMNRLSTTSMVAIEAVSEAKASRDARPRLTTRISDTIVSA